MLQIMKNESRVVKKHLGEINTLADLVDITARVYGNELHAIWQKSAKHDFKKSFMELWNDVVVNANYLMEAGYSGQRIGIFGKLNYKWMLKFLAVVCSGNIAVPLDKKDNVLEEKLGQAKLAGIYGSETVSEKYDLKLFQVKYSGNSEELLNLDYQIMPEDDAVIIFTSGTTGRSKGVILSHKNIVSNTKCGCFFLGKDFGEGDTSMPVLPPTHMLVITVGILTCMLYGGTLCFGRGNKYIVKDFAVFKPRVLVLVPMIVENIYDKIYIKAKKQIGEEKLKKAINLSNSLRKIKIDVRRKAFSEIHKTLGGNLETIICGGAKLDPKAAKGMTDFGINVCEGYGITECSPVISCNRLKSNVFGSVGVKGPDEFCQIKVIDNELCVKGDIVFKGYFENEKAYKEVVKDGWFHTGDLCKIKNGRIYIVGRKKNLIILSDGNNVSPEEIENYFKGFEYLKSFFVKEHDNKIIAMAYPNMDLDEDLDYMKEAIRIKIKEVNLELPAYKRISDVIFAEKDYEKTALGKIKRFKY